MKSVQVPSKWSDVSMRQFMAYVAMMEESGDETEKVFATISIMTGADVDEVKAWNMDSFNKVWSTLGFLTTNIDAKRSSEVKLANGKTYKVVSNPSAGMSYGAFIDLMHNVKDNETAKKNLNKAFACMLIEKPKWFWQAAKYDGKDYKEKCALVFDLPVTIVKPHTDFFLQNYLRYSKSLLVYSALYMKATKWRKKVKAAFMPSTDGLTL